LFGGQVVLIASDRPVWSAGRGVSLANTMVALGPGN